MDIFTNKGDRIRKMTDDELAEMLLNTYCANDCNRDDGCPDDECNKFLVDVANKFVRSPDGPEIKSPADMIKLFNDALYVAVAVDEFKTEVFNPDRPYVSDSIHKYLSKLFEDGVDEVQVGRYSGKLVRVTVPSGESITGVLQCGDDFKPAFIYFYRGCRPTLIRSTGNGKKPKLELVSKYVYFEHIIKGVKIDSHSNRSIYDYSMMQSAKRIPTEDPDVFIIDEQMK